MKPVNQVGVLVRVNNVVQKHFFMRYYMVPIGLLSAEVRAKARYALHFDSDARLRSNVRDEIRNEKA